jgi:emp24/gp25L/p24 family/GOLD
MLPCLILLFLSQTFSLRFDIPSTSGQGTIRCLTQSIQKSSITKGIIDSPPLPFQKLDFVITDDSGNKLFSKLDLVSLIKFSFTTTQDTSVNFCVTATLDAGQVPDKDKKRDVYLHIAGGSEETVDPASKSRFVFVEV